MSHEPETGPALMRRWVLQWPDSLEASLEEISRRAWPPSDWPLPRAVLLGGMGGSGMACRLASAAARDLLERPAVICQDPRIPAWVGPQDLAVIVSYSGQTWEALAMCREARARGVRLLLVASGGDLADEAAAAEGGDEDAGGPRRLFRVPSGFAPRAALPWMLPPVLLALMPEAPARQRILADLEEAVALLREETALWSRGAALPGRDPADLAARIAGRHLYVYATEESARPAAIRWKCQILENGRQMASEAAFPELAHNEIMGWEFACGRQQALFLVLDGAHPAVERARSASEAAAVAELEATGGQVVRVPGRGASPTARLLTHAALADMVSIALAARLGHDPFPVAAIDRVKLAWGKEPFG